MNAVAVFILVASSRIDYDDHTFGLKSNDSSFVLINDSGVWPTVQDNYVIYNIGRIKVQAELWYGDEVQWFGIVHGATIYPGETKILDNDGKKYYYTGLKLINNEEIRVIAHCEGGYLPSPFTPDMQFHFYKFLLKTLKFCVKYFTNHFVASVFKQLSLLFFPENKPNIWQEVLDNVTPLLEENTREILTSLLQNEINVYKEKLSILSDEMHSGVPIKEHYMNLAWEIVGLENKFSFSSTLSINENINLYILPMYSSVVSMAINFYMLGVKYNTEIKLDDNNISQILRYANKTYENASKYFRNLSRNAVDYVYNNSEAQGIFNSMMSVRSHLAIHGEEYLPIWKYKLENPSSNKEVYNPVISYSTFFGKPTANLYAQATPIDVPQPLCPKMIDGKRNILKKITVYMWTTNPSILKIGGAKLFFENGDEYTMGTVTIIAESFDLEGAKILQLTAYGEGKIDGLKFYLSNGQIHVFGQTISATFENFKLQHHHIPSFYLSSDSRDLNGQAANIAVSFQWYVKDD